MFGIIMNSYSTAGNTPMDSFASSSRVHILCAASKACSRKLKYGIYKAAIENFSHGRHSIARCGSY